jgi:SAM-dependent methyltransferase
LNGSNLQKIRRKLQKALRHHGFFGTLKLCGKNILLLASGRTPPSEDPDFDREHGTDTGGVIELSDLKIEHPMWEHGVRYQASPPGSLELALGNIEDDLEGFVFIDFGSGKGATLLRASSFPFRKIIGVEISYELSRIARENIARYRNPAQQCWDIESVCAHAVEFPLPDEDLVLYFYNPFSEHVMNELLQRIRRSLLENPRKIFLIYYNPVAIRLMDGLDWLERIRITEEYAAYTAR